MVAHASLPEADLHEVKGASTATIGKVPVASGAGTTAFKYINPHGATSFVNIAAPYTLAYPAAYAKAIPVTTAAGVALEFTEGIDAKLTYTGADTVVARLIFNVALDQASGAARDIRLAIYKDGAIIPASVVINTTSSGVKVLTTSIVDTTLVTGNYLEAYMQNDGASGDIRIYSFYLSAFCMRG